MYHAYQSLVRSNELSIESSIYSLSSHGEGAADRKIPIEFSANWFGRKFIAENYILTQT